MSLSAPQEIPVELCRASPTARPVQAVKVEILARSIAEIGLRQPINVRPIGDGYEIRGGGHRHAAFVKLGFQTIPAFVRDDDDLRAELAEIDENLIRSDLTPIERDIAVARRKAIYEQLHPETVHGAAGKGRPKSRHHGDSEPPAARFTKDTADRTGQGERTVQRAVGHVETIGEETLAGLVDTSLNATVELDALTQLSPERREAVIVKARAGDDVSAQVELRKQRREDREGALAERIRALPEKRYGLIYADVPRHFNVYSDDTGLGRSPENHYPTMSFDELLTLPINDIAADDCILVYWSTAASLLDDIEIMAEWGFASLRPRDGLGKLSKPNGVALPPVGRGTYRSMQVWDKIRMGLGYWFRDRHEIVLIGVRGNVIPPAPGTQDESLFSESKGEHSAKPNRVAAMLDRLWPNIPKIEIFARAARDNWDVWGLEAPLPPHNPETGELIAEGIPEPAEADDAGAKRPEGAYPVMVVDANAEAEAGEGDGSGSVAANVSADVTSAASEQAVTSPNFENDDLEIPNFLRRGHPDCMFKTEAA